MLGRRIHEKSVHELAEETGDQTHEGAEAHREDGRESTDDEGNLGTVEKLGQNVGSPEIRPEDIVVTRRIRPRRQRCPDGSQELEEGRLALRGIRPNAVQFLRNQRSSVKGTSKCSGISEEGDVGRRRDGERFRRDMGIRSGRGGEHGNAAVRGEHEHFGTLIHLEERSNPTGEICAELEVFNCSLVETDHMRRAIGSLVVII